MNNPNTTSTGRRHAKHELQAMVSHTCLVVIITLLLTHFVE